MQSTFGRIPGVGVGLWMLLAGAGVTLGQLPANGTQTGTGYAQGAQDPNSNQQTAGVGSSQMQEPVQPAQMPPISLEEQQYIEKLLEHWEKSSSQIKHCTCEFTRWDYDPQKVSWRDPRNNSLAAHTIMIGQIRYAQPDKAEYESNQAWDFAGPPDQPGGEPKLVERDRTSQHEKWVCDGSAIYDYDYVNKRLYETVIPPEMRGNGLANSPLPFFFGAKKDLILNRYYLRVITPQGAENEYWLEAVPKTREDAQIYQKVQIVIASEDFLPKSLHVFAPNYDPVNNPVSRHFEFQNRKVNSPFAGLNQLLGGGIRPKTPIGWERVDLSSQAAAGAAGASSSLPNGGQPTNGPVIK